MLENPCSIASMETERIEAIMRNIRRLAQEKYPQNSSKRIAYKAKFHYGALNDEIIRRKNNL